MTEETRLLQASLLEKMLLQSFAKDTNLWRFCCSCKAGLTTDNKPIYYDLSTMLAITKSAMDASKYDKKAGVSHGYCINCANIVYMNNFGKTYDEIHKLLKPNHEKPESCYGDKQGDACAINSLNSGSIFYETKVKTW